MTCKKIPIAAARRIAKEYEYDQVVIIARKVGPNGGEHVTTYGVDVVNCAVAGKIGDFIKHKIMGWHTERGQIVVDKDASPATLGPAQ